jgi:hypothetical protein
MRLSILLRCIVLLAFIFIAACSSDDDGENSGYSSNYYFVTLDPAGGVLPNAIGNCPKYCTAGDCFAEAAGRGNNYTKAYRNSFGTILDLSDCKPEKSPTDVYQFEKWYILGSNPKEYHENLYDIPVNGRLTLQAVYKTIRGVVTFDADGGYFPDGWSESTDNTSFTVLTETDGKLLPANMPTTVVKPGFRFEGWYVYPDESNTFDTNFETFDAITVKPKWEGVDIAVCCKVEFRDEFYDDPITRFLLLYPSNIAYGTPIIIPDWYDSSDDDWGGEGTDAALKEWTVTGSDGMNGTYQPGTIVSVINNVDFKAVRDPSVKGVSTRPELEGISGSNHYRLINDIDVSGSAWTPISGFSGVLNGGGHTVTGLNFASTQTATVLGFFSELSGEADNLTIQMTNGSVAYTSLTGDVYYGVFAGKLIAGGKLFNTSAIGELSVNATNHTTGSSKYDAYAGGLVGSAEIGSTVTNSVSRVNLTVTNEVVSGILGASNPFAYAGGIAGIISGGILTNIYSTGNVSAVSIVGGTGMMSDDTIAYAGGIAGYQSAGTIKFSYASGQISADTTSPDKPEAYAGGIVGAIAGGKVENTLAINTDIDVSSRHPNGSDRGDKSAGRITGLASGADFQKIYGNSNLENLYSVGEKERAFYFPDLKWFWHDELSELNEATVGFNHGFDDAYPWVDPYEYGRTEPNLYPIFYWEVR